MCRYIAAAILASLALLTSCRQHDTPRSPEITVEVQLEAISKAKTPEDVRPYDEALVWHEYLVKRVLAGKLDAAKIRVAHWSVVAAKPVPVKEKIGEISTLKIVPFDSIKGLQEIASSDDLEVMADEPPRFLDLSQPLGAGQTPGPVRFDYRGNLSEKMRLFWKLRGQLRVVVMGNSYAIKGINTRSFFQDEAGHMPVGDGKYPVALNLAPAGGNLKLQCLMLHEYVLPLPKIEWIIWTISPFLFNERREDESRYDEFTASPGWAYDQKNKPALWPAPPQTALLTLKDLQPLNLNSMDFWVKDQRVQTTLPASLEEQHQAILKECHVTRFTWSDALFAQLSSTVHDLTAKGIQFIVLTPPIHPFVKDAAAADRHGTSHEGYAEMVTHLQTLAKVTPRMKFLDIHKDGHHDFKPDEFYDSDHLNGRGAGHLTALVLGAMQSGGRP